MTLLLGDTLVLSSTRITSSSISQQLTPAVPSSSPLNLIEGFNEEERVKSRAAEIVVGDETGSVILTAQSGDQIDTILALGSAGHPFTIRNAYTELTNDEKCLRLLVDTFFGEITSDTSQPPLPPSYINTKNNLSKIRYERI